MITWDEIVNTVHNRIAQNAPLLSQMIEVKRRYGGDWVMPYADAADAPDMPSTTPQLIADAVDFTGMMAASVMPHMSTPALDPKKEKGVRSREYADVRRKILGYTHHKSRTRLHLRRSYRHLAGYFTTSLIVIPDLQKMKMPRLEVRDPLATYPEPKAPEDLSPPSNCAYIFAKSVSWLKANYPECNGMFGAQISGEELWDLVEWVDEDCTVIGIIGPHEMQARQLALAGGNVPSKELHRWGNPTGMCPAYIPNRVTIDRVISQIGNLTGQVDLMARLQALAITAGEKAIFKDRYVIGDGMQPPQLVSGDWKDGRTGQVNILLNAKAVGELSGTPDPQAQMMIDRLERNVRMSSGLVPQAGGESYGALRTGRGMDSLMGVAVDPRLQEMQEIIEVALEHLNEVILAQYKAYWGDREYSVHSGWAGDRGIVEFTPNTHIEITDNVVSYVIPGTDVQGTTIQLGQLFGVKAISLATMRERHPYIDDPAGEGDRVEEELLEQAVLEAIATQAAQGSIPITYVAAIERFRKQEGDIIKAVDKADEWLREQQAAAAPPEAPQDPTMQPGVAPMGAAPPMGDPAMEAEVPMPPGDIGATGELRDFRRLSEALSQAPPVTAG